MIQFAGVFPDPKIVSALRTQLGWTHFRAIIARNGTKGTGDAGNRDKRPKARHLVRFDQYPVLVNGLRFLCLNCQII